MKTQPQTNSQPVSEFNVYIGLDERELIAAEVCKYSIKKRMSQQVPVTFLRSVPEYERLQEPLQSTAFTYTRFLIPHIQQYKGFSIFCDCDFLFLDDIVNLFNIIDRTKAVSVVKHPTYIPHSDIKMDNIQQHAMFRKNWASLMVFNNEHPANRILTPQHINTIMPGRLLHQFHWLEDDQIGSIPLNWNVLNDYYLIDNPKAIHYTDGGPWFHNYKQTTYSHFWENECDEYYENI